MKSWAVVRSGEPLQCIEINTPKPAGTQVLLKVTDCGVCHSDVHFWHGAYKLGKGKELKLADRGVTLPRAPGHEIAGEVVALGPDARGVKVGEKFLVYPWIGCGTCEYCRKEEDNMCSAQRSLGVVQDGGFASHVVAPHPRYLVPYGSLDPALASTFTCSGITTYGAVRKALPQSPDTPVALIGAGGLGLSAIAMLKALGHRAIIAVDIDPKKREAALAAGATRVVDSSAPDAAAKLQEAAGGPLQAVIDFVNVDQTVELAFNSLTKGGKFVVVGVGGGELLLSFSMMVFKVITIQASLTGTIQDLRDVVKMAQDGRLKSSPVIKMRKDQATEALVKLERGEIIGRAVLVGD